MYCLKHVLAATQINKKKRVQATAVSVAPPPPLSSYFKIFIYRYEYYEQISHYIY